MSDERRLLAAGMPLEDAISMCDDLRREGALRELVDGKEKERRHRCSCVGQCERCTCE